MAARRFKPSLWSTLAAAAGIAATVALGLWQVGRAQDKAALMTARQAGAIAAPVHLGQTPVAAASVEERQVEASGTFDPKGLVLLDNRVRSGQAGYEVVMPLRIEGEGGMHVLVNRGWVKGSGDRSQLPQVVTPAGAVHVTGLAVVPGKHIYELSPQTPAGTVWQSLSLERYREQKKSYALQPIMLQQTNDTGDGLVREWPTPARSIDVHRSYAVQWFALALLIAIAYVGFALRRVPAEH